MSHEDYYWSCPKDLSAVLRGYERRERIAWERSLMLYNVWVGREDRLTYDDLFSGRKGVTGKDDYQAVKERFRKAREQRQSKSDG